MAIYIPNPIIDKIYSHNNITTYSRPDMLINSYVWTLGNDFGNGIEREEMKKKTSLKRLKEKCVKLATEQRLAEHPKCEFCNQQATTCHHFIHQSRSNYLRCDPRNLIPICPKHHYLMHNGYEGIYAGFLTLKYGKKWYNDLIADSRITIRDTKGYWQNKLSQLQGGEG
jgi:hypothetical protein